MSRPVMGAGSRTGAPSVVLGMLIFVAVEAMFFAGLLSAFTIGKANAVGWPPLGQPRPSAAMSALATGILLASAVPLFLAARAFGREVAAARARLRLAIALGAAFVGLQAYEWARLVGFGLTLRSSSYGSFFYLVIGAHALHVLAALATLAWLARRLRAGTADAGTFTAAQVFWYFVVGLWPMLYTLVYLL